MSGYNNAGIVGYYWRQFCPETQPLTATTEADRSVFIPIPQTLRIQGARHFNLIIIQRCKGLQGGFLMEHHVTQQPSFGVLEWEPTGWTYIPLPGIIGEDTFSYALSYMGQVSKSDTVTVTITGGSSGSG